MNHLCPLAPLHPSGGAEEQRSVGELLVRSSASRLPPHLITLSARNRQIYLTPPSLDMVATGSYIIAHESCRVKSPQEQA